MVDNGCKWWGIMGNIGELVGNSHEWVEMMGSDGELWGMLRNYKVVE